jgi:glutamine---fructose-6-phosphate transaminase (isomerizing)
MMMRTKMRQEIFDQIEVSAKVIQQYKSVVLSLNKEAKEKKNVFLMGTGASLNACLASRHAFMKYCKLMHHVVAAADIETVAEIMGKDSLVILISQSGNSYETQRAVEILKNKNIEFWGITNEPESMLARESNRTLYMNAGVEVSSATKTYMATVLILYMIASGNDAEAIEDIDKLPEDIKQTLGVLDKVVDKIASGLMDKNVMYLVGIGAHGAAAGQGALMIKEKTFIPAEGLPLSEFRHGTVEVVKPGLPVIISASTPSRVEEALFHGEYLSDLSADVYLVVDCPVETGKIPKEKIVCIKNSVHEAFSHLTAGVFYQLLAESIAFHKNYDVDGFKFLKKCVDKY